MSSFTEQLDAEGIAFFNDTCEKPFDQQAVAFLNAFWNEVGSQATFVFEVAFEMIKYADMHAKGCNYVHLYEMGNTLDFNIGLYFYEQLCKECDSGKYKSFDTDEYKVSQPTMMTAIKRKTEIRDKVDANNDGKISLLEYLLYQYRETCKPADFVTRSMAAPDEHPQIKKARLALEDVSKRIQAYEAEKQRLTDLAALPGVKGLGAKNQLAQIESGPLKEDLNRALITAEAAVRICVKKFGGCSAADSAEAMPSQGATFWMQKDLELKKNKYGRR